MKYVSLYRIWVIVKMAVKFFAQVILFQRRHRHGWNEQTRLKWEALLKKQAAEYKRTALHLEGLLIKVGQFLSTRADIMPPVFIHELEDLVDRVPPVPWEDAKRILEEDWNGPYGDVLHKISEQPVASASIGEVYHAYLHSGTSVAVKIQRPRIEQIIQTDFKALRIVMWLAKHFTSFGKQINFDSLYKETYTVIGQELNFRKELQNGLYFRNRYEHFPEVDVPFYYSEYSTRRVLVMDWVEGARITDLSYLEAQGIDRKDLAMRLLRGFLEQLLQEGKFHADPHPGNILVRPDGTIVLIDFGMVGEISKRDALAVRQLVEGIVIGDYERVVDALEQLRFLLPHANKQEIKQVIELMIQTYLQEDLTTMDDAIVQQILEDIQTIVRKQPIQLPSEFAFFGRAVSIFVGILYILNPELDLLAASKPLVLEWLQKQGKEEEAPAASSPLQLLTQTLRPLLTLPRQIQQALDEPQRRREWEQEQHHQSLQHQLLLSKKRDALLFCLISAVALYISCFFSQSMLIYGSGGLLLVSILYYIGTLRSHRRLLRERMSEDGRRKGTKTGN
ncbi:ABC1 kinase family protein [Ectobacillus ponti]|uniref:AarF/UbiB family protein n=1 Tax=Ectobacillus ponti TaxID=2961894 RepID=A0AA41X868_9BACI|nr:AarF/UbiB family protein [Ectobacillus ponti]MCP8968078.1 AarF/UbiB family protein [Ectobacillus ponti]